MKLARKVPKGWGTMHVNDFVAYNMGYIKINAQMKEAQYTHDANYLYWLISYLRIYQFLLFFL